MTICGQRSIPSWRIVANDPSRLGLADLNGEKIGGPAEPRPSLAQDLDTSMCTILWWRIRTSISAITGSLRSIPCGVSPFGANAMAATLLILLAFAPGGAVADQRERGDAHAGAVGIPTARACHPAVAGKERNRQLVRQMMLEGAVLSIVAESRGPWITSWISKTFAWFFPANAIPLVLNGNMELLSGGDWDCGIFSFGRHVMRRAPRSGDPLTRRSLRYSR